MIESKIEKLISEALAEHGYDDVFLVDLVVNNTRVEIFLDADSSVTFEKCRKVSRYIEAILDQEKWLGERYTLEVSSAGVGKPLKYERQYTKNIGRKIEIKTLEGEKYKGTLDGVDNGVVTVYFTEKVKEGKKKKVVEIREEISIDDIKEAKIKVSF